MSKTKPQTLPPSSLLNRVILGIIGPLAAATFITSLTNNQDSRASIALFLGVVGVVSGLLGWRWYGLPESGLRGGRPLFAGIAFAVLAWVIVFLARLYFVDSQNAIPRRNRHSVAPMSAPDITNTNPSAAPLGSCSHSWFTRFKKHVARISTPPEVSPVHLK